MQIARTDRHLGELIAMHEELVGGYEITPSAVITGLSLRLALSCLVDADHADTAGFDRGWRVPASVEPRWMERLESLDNWVESLGGGSKRDSDRAAFYRACRHGSVENSIVACEGAVGIGKTTAVTAWLLRRAIATNSRRLFVVAPYTAILSQTAEALRQALVLPDEVDRVDQVVAEHHHRADFDSRQARDLAVLWSAPIVLTTAVQFFETIAACDPGRLRKLHSLPGSVVFLDEVHASLPTPLWRQHWIWLHELANRWSCSFVLASGSLARFWTLPKVVGDSASIDNIKDIVPTSLNTRLAGAERSRVHYRSLGLLNNPDELIAAVLREPGPRLVVMNTVQSAAVIAARFRHLLSENATLHLSTALCPRDRTTILENIRVRLAMTASSREDLVVISTSLLEAGVDLSFRSVFRERFSTASLIQIGGRANRHREYVGQSIVTDFFMDCGHGLSRHPNAELGANTLARAFQQNWFHGELTPANLITKAMQDEAWQDFGSKRAQQLVKAETARNYPEVAKLSRVIDEDTQLVVVVEGLRDRLMRGEQIGSRDLLAESVQMHSSTASRFQLESIRSRGEKEIYWWPYAYDRTFLGYMAGVIDV